MSARISTKKKTLVVYRIENDNGIGPWFGGGYDEHVGQHVDFYQDMNTPGQEIWLEKVDMRSPGDDFRCAMKTIVDVVRWFKICAEGLIAHGYVLAKVEVAAYMVGTQQVVFKPEAVVTKEILSLEEIFSQTVA